MVYSVEPRLFSITFVEIFSRFPCAKSLRSSTTLGVFLHDIRYFTPFPAACLSRQLKKLLVKQRQMYPDAHSCHGFENLSTYLCALFLKVFGIFVCLCTALARDSVPLRRWSDTYLYELYHSISFFVHSLGLIAVTIPSMKTHCAHRASP